MLSKLKYGGMRNTFGNERCSLWIIMIKFNSSQHRICPRHCAAYKDLSETQFLFSENWHSANQKYPLLWGTKIPERSLKLISCDLPWFIVGKLVRIWKCVRYCELLWKWWDLWNEKKRNENRQILVRSYISLFIDNLRLKINCSWERSVTPSLFLQPQNHFFGRPSFYCWCKYVNPFSLNLLFAVNH